MTTLRDVVAAIEARLGEPHHPFGVAAEWGSNSFRPHVIARIDSALLGHVRVMITPPDGRIVTMIVAETVPDLAGAILRHQTHHCGTVAPLAIVVECVGRIYSPPVTAATAPKPKVPLPIARDPKVDGHCRSAKDGDCSWERCPQLHDNEPEVSGRHCPLDTSAEDEA